MGTNDMLLRSITYEEALLKNYKQYASLAEYTDIGSLFARLAEEKALHLEQLYEMKKKYCKT